MKIVNIKAKFNNPPILKYWGIYDKDKLNHIITNNKLKLLYFQTSGLCDLECIYCPTKSGKKKKEELSKNRRKDILIQFKNLGGEIIHYIGEGEPLLDPNFWSDYETIKELGLKVVIFTHGGLLNEKTVKKLKDIDASIILKYHSHNEVIQDLMANRKGYTKQRNSALAMLLKYGFNSGKETNLGFDILVMKPNYKHISRYWRYCRDNNIFPMVKKIFFAESAELYSIKKSLNVGSNKVKELFYKLSEIDRKEYGYFWIPSPPWAAVKCNYYFYHIFITNLGEVKPCLGVNRIGDIRKNTLEYFWNTDEMKEIKKVSENVTGKCKTCANNIIDDCYGCPCRKIYHHGTGKIKDIYIKDSCFSSCGL